MSTIGKRRVLFYRDYQGFTGGHLKVRDYFEHLRASESFEPKVYLTPGSRPDHLWPAESLVAEYDPDSADVLFILAVVTDRFTRCPTELTWKSRLRKPAKSLQTSSLRG